MRQNGACLLSLLCCCAAGPLAAHSTALRVEVRRGPCRSRARPVAALGRAQLASKHVLSSRRRARFMDIRVRNTSVWPLAP